MKQKSVNCTIMKLKDLIRFSLILQRLLKINGYYFFLTFFLHFFIKMALKIEFLYFWNCKSQKFDIEMQGPESFEKSINCKFVKYKIVNCEDCVHLIRPLLKLECPSWARSPSLILNMNMIMIINSIITNLKKENHWWSMN